MIEEHSRLVEQFGFYDASKLQNVKPVAKEALPLTDRVLEIEYDLPPTIEKDEQII